MTICPLSKALVDVLPSAVVTHRHEHVWHSASFSGVRIILGLQCNGLEAAQAKSFAANIHDHEFCLPDRLVADIVVTSLRKNCDGVALIIEALLLDDEV
jgi:hypothetical protein